MKTTIRIALEIAVIFAAILSLHTWYLRKEKSENVPSAVEESRGVSGARNEKNASILDDAGKKGQATVEENQQAGYSVNAWLVFLRKKYGITFVVMPGVDGTKRIVQDLSSLPVEKAILALFNGYDFFLQYAAGENTASTLRQVYVFLPGAARGKEPLAQSVTQEAPDQQDGQFAEQFHQALRRSPREAEEMVVHALAGEDENIRNLAVRLASEEGVPLSTGLYEQLLAEDPSEIVRAAAFDAIIMRSEADGIDLQSLVDAGLEDPSPLIVERAHALREALESPVLVTPSAQEEEVPAADATSSPQ